MIFGRKNKLSTKVNEIIQKEPQICLFSVASLWEITIKISLNKLDMQYTLSELEELLHKNKIEVLSINFLHLKELIQLPFHHKDPFDRLIISQARTEKLMVISISIDKFFPDYGELIVLW